jgi:hypothetical protein
MYVGGQSMTLDKRYPWLFTRWFPWALVGAAVLIAAAHYLPGGTGPGGRGKSDDGRGKGDGFSHAYLARAKWEEMTQAERAYVQKLYVQDLRVGVSLFLKAQELVRAQPESLARSKKYLRIVSYAALVQSALQDCERNPQADPRKYQELIDIGRTVLGAK